MLQFTKNDALAAVIVPWGFTKAGFNLARLSNDVTRIPLSVSTIFDTPGTVSTFIFI